MQILTLDNSFLRINEMKNRASRKNGSKVMEAAIGLPLEIKEVKPGLHELAEGIRLRPIYRISWSSRPVVLFNRWTLGKEKKSGKFVRLSPDMIIEPPEVEFRYSAEKYKQEIEGKAVFLSTRFTDTSLTAIFAIRTGGSWLELYRWHSSWSELALSRMDVCSF
jgi:hypothetical protein